MIRRCGFVLPLAAAFVLVGCGSDDAAADDDPAMDSGVEGALDSGAGDGDEEDASSADDLDASTGEDASAGEDAGADEDASVEPIVVQPSAAGDVVITEIQSAPLGYTDDGEAEWVEVHNPSATYTYDLGGCVFSDKDGDADYTISQGIVIAPGGYAVLSSAVFTVATHGFVSQEVYGTTGTGLSGTADGPNIVCNATVIDAVAYAAENGFSAPSESEGHTLQLDPAHLNATDNDAGASWCFGATVFFTAMALDNYGTPGAANADCP